MVTGAALCGGGMEAADGVAEPVVVSGSVIVGVAVGEGVSTASRVRRILCVMGVGELQLQLGRGGFEGVVDRLVAVLP